MGQKNNVICNYLSEPAVFADFINGSIHNGKKVVFPHQLSASETVYYQKERQRPSDKRRPKYIERQRDALKTVCNNNCYIIIGIEAQDKVNYTMPLRCMEYDVIEYKRQINELGRNRTKQLTDSEFLSGMAKDEKLNPVTTIVFYHGEEPYDGCINLHDMLELGVENQTYKRFISDYHINLIKVENLDENMFETGLHELIGFLKRRNDKQGLVNFIEQDKERIQNMDEATLDAVSVMLSLPAFIAKGEDKMEGEEHNLCKALKEWLSDERNAGIEEGERRGRQEGLKEGEIRGRREGLKEGETRGRREGLKEGETRFANLTSALLAVNRISDLAKAASDEAFRESLYQEFVL